MEIRVSVQYIVMLIIHGFLEYVSDHVAVGLLVVSVYIWNVNTYSNPAVFFCLNPVELVGQSISSARTAEIRIAVVL